MMFETVENWALHAVVDGELSDVEKADVERLLQRDPEARRMLDVIRREKSALHQAYDPVLAETVPPHLVAAVTARATPNLSMAAWRNVAAAGLVAFLIGGGAGWFARQPDIAMAETLADKAINTYQVYATDFGHPVEIGANDKDHLQHWLEKRIGVAFAIPDLQPQGYGLVGGRLLAEGDKPAGLLMYENASKQRLIIYVAANQAQSEAAMLVKQKGPLVTCYWVEKDMVYALAGEQGKDEMLGLAAAAHEGFDKDG